VNPIITTPDESSIQNIHYVENRKGSFGAGFISRYDVIFDYKNQMYYTSETKRLKEPFLYNRSGIEVVLGGTFFSSEKVSLNPAANSYSIQTTSTNAFDISALNSKMVEKPIYSIQNVRDYSQAKTLGIAKGAYEASVKYAKEREQFGQPIANFQAISFKLADMATKIQAAELLIRKSAHLKNTHQPVTTMSAMAKYYASEICVQIATDAIQIFGGYGYTKDFPVEKFFRDSKLCTIGEGTSEIQKLVISRNILKEG
jgi:hypothetical protein